VQGVQRQPTDGTQMIGLIVIDGRPN